MEVDLSAIAPLECERLLNSLVVPRPIAWVTSVDASGTRNLAPFSYFTVASRNPPVVMISFGGEKDTLTNIQATGEFVINIVSPDLARAMVASSEPHAPEIDEIGLLGLPVIPSTRVRVPRLAQARGALECTFWGVQEIGDSTLLFGAVLHLHAVEAVMRNGRIAMEALAPVGRLGGAYYCTADQPWRLDKPEDRLTQVPPP